jgi:hypothetical protein
VGCNVTGERSGVQMIPEQGKQDKPVAFHTEQHEPEMTQEEKDAQEWMNASLGKPIKEKVRIEGEFIHYAIKEEPNKTIGIYQNGKRVDYIDFWIFDQRAYNARKE